MEFGVRSKLEVNMLVARALGLGKVPRVKEVKACSVPMMGRICCYPSLLLDPKPVLQLSCFLAGFHPVQIWRVRVACWWIQEGDAPLVR